MPKFGHDNFALQLLLFHCFVKSNYYHYGSPYKDFFERIAKNNIFLPNSNKIPSAHSYESILRSRVRSVTFSLVRDSKQPKEDLALKCVKHYAWGGNRMEILHRRPNKRYLCKKSEDIYFG